MFKRTLEGNYIVMCRVSGGVTGTREAPLKKDGQVQYFATKDEAQAEAIRLVAMMNVPHSLATFEYWAEER